MKELIIKYRKIIISIIVIFLSIFLYSNKPYSLYDISYLQKINKKSAENSKDFYLNKMKKTINNNDSIKKNIFYVKKNQNLGYILEKVGIQTPKKILEKKRNNCLYNIYVNDPRPRPGAPRARRRPRGAG